MFGFSKKQLLIVAVIVIIALKLKATIVKVPGVGTLVA
jgi:hypothetical protein